MKNDYVIFLIHEECSIPSFFFRWFDQLTEVRRFHSRGVCRLSGEHRNVVTCAFRKCLLKCTSKDFSKCFHFSGSEYRDLVEISRRLPRNLWHGFVWRHLLFQQVRHSVVTSCIWMGINSRHRPVIGVSYMYKYVQFRIICSLLHLRLNPTLIKCMKNGATVFCIFGKELR
jgi:hypothetical protein